MLQGLGWLAVSFFLLSCGAGGSSGGGESTESSSEEAPSIRPVGQIAESEVATSLSRLPDLTTGLEVTAASATTQGSFLQGILPGNVVTTVSGPVADAARDAQEALENKYWTRVQEKGAEYRGGLQKCRLLQTLGRSLTTYFQMYKTSCLLRSFDQKGVNLIRRVSGEEVEKGEFFKASQKEAVRILEVDGIDFFKTAKVVSTTKLLDNGVYQGHLVMCRANQSVIGRYQYQMVPLEKKFTVSYEMILPTYGIDANREFKGSGSYSGFWTSSGAQIVMDKTRPRIVSSQFTEKAVDGSNTTHQSLLEISDVQLQIKSLEATSKIHSIETLPATTVDRLSAQVLSLLTVGMTPETFKIVEAAIKSKDRYKDSAGEAISHQNKIGIAYDSDKTLGFKTNNGVKGIKTVDTVDFGADPLLSKTTVEAPQLGSFDSPLCLSAGQSTYRASPSQAQVAELLKTCDLSLQSLESLCDSLEAEEGDILRALKDSPKGIP